MSNGWLRVDLDPVQEELIEEMRQKVAKQFGVTVQGQFVTLRWSNGLKSPLKSVTMVVIDADDGVTFEDEDTEDK